MQLQFLNLRHCEQLIIYITFMKIYFADISFMLKAFWVELFVFCLLSKNFIA